MTTRLPSHGILKANNSFAACGFLRLNNLFTCSRLIHALQCSSVSQLVPRTTVFLCSTARSLNPVFFGAATRFSPGGFLVAYNSFLGPSFLVLISSMSTDCLPTITFVEAGLLHWVNSFIPISFLMGLGSFDATGLLTHHNSFAACGFLRAPNSFVTYGFLMSRDSFVFFRLEWVHPPIVCDQGRTLIPQSVR